ncbi:MAG: DUF3040 domain-containing protein [Actinomycetota bacterium]
MALSMDEQRILAEIERKLAAEDPGLAGRLSAFSRPGLTSGFRTPRGRVLASIIAIAVVTFASLMVYSFSPLRGAHQGVRGPAKPTQKRSEQSVQPAAASSAGAAARSAGASGAQRLAPRRAARPSAPKVRPSALPHVSAALVR